MNRRGFLTRLCAATVAVAVAVAPAIELLSEENTICGKGLLWCVENSNNTFTYRPLTIEDFNEIITMLENTPSPQDYTVWLGSSNYQTIQNQFFK